LCSFNRLRTPTAPKAGKSAKSGTDKKEKASGDDAVKEEGGHSTERRDKLMAIQLEAQKLWDEHKVSSCCAKCFGALGM
jgi:hypothetical protein